MPLQNQLHVDSLLSNVSIQYRNANYQAQNVFPAVPVIKSTDLYRIYDRNFRIPDTLRAIGGVARETGFEVSTATYQLQWHSLVDYVADRSADNYDLADLRRDTTEFLSDKILLRLERMTMDLFTTTNWSLNVSLAAGAEFSANTTTSNPVPIFDTAATTVIANSGKKPNFGLIRRATFTACKNHTSVLDRTKYTSKDMDVGILASLFGLENLYVSDISYDSSAEGVAASLTAILDEVAFVGWKPANPGPLQPSCGYTFKYNRGMVKRYREEKREADAIEVNMEFIPRVVASLCGYIIRNTE